MDKFNLEVKHCCERHPAKKHIDLVSLLFCGVKDKNSDLIYKSKHGLEKKVGDFGDGIYFSDKAKCMHEHAWNQNGVY